MCPGENTGYLFRLGALVFENSYPVKQRSLSGETLFHRMGTHGYVAMWHDANKYQHTSEDLSSRAEPASSTATFPTN